MLPDLHLAAISGDITTVDRLINSGVPIDLMDKGSGHTPLMSVCSKSDANLKVVQWLVEHGADINAVECTPPPPTFDFSDILEGEDIDPKIKEMAELSQSLSKDLKPNHHSVLSLATKHAPIEVIDHLIKQGADLQFRTQSGYTITIDAVYRRDDRVLDLIVAAGAPLDGITSYGESAVNVLSHWGRFDALRKLIQQGADPAPLKWTPLMHAIALGSGSEVEALLVDGSDLEATDSWSRNPFLLAVHTGDTEKAALLLNAGSNPHAVGRCSKPALSYPVTTDKVEMLEWILDMDFEIDPVDEFECTPLLDAAELGSPKCFKALLERGADISRKDHIGYTAIQKATHPEIIQLLIEAGEDPSELDDDELRKFIGLGEVDVLPVTREQYEEGRMPRFGESNPQRMQLPFWEAMVRCGWSGFKAAGQFGDSSYEREGPVWCHDRFGMSLTCLPDGRFIQIAGEHEDHYDPDFCIYNDVFIHDGNGGIEIFGYPREVFPPTDFHTATLIAPWIYIIGNLGYPDDRGTAAPVFRLHVETRVIEKVSTSGNDPGWIHSHTATLEDGRIRISGGQVFEIDDSGEGQLRDNQESFVFDPQSRRWE